VLIFLVLLCYKNRLFALVDNEARAYPLHKGYFYGSSVEGINQKEER